MSGNLKCYLRMVAKIHVEGGDEVDEADKDYWWAHLTKVEQDAANEIVEAVFGEYL